MKCAKYVYTAIAVSVAAGLLWKTQEVTAGVRAGLLACANVIIPSLFPFMILAGIIASTKIGAVLSKGVSFVTRPLLGLPENLGAVFLMSFVGGFPVGAKMLSSMLERGEIDRKTAERALCFCVNAGPSFLISAVGANMLGSMTAGLVLLAAQICSSFLVAAFVCRKYRRVSSKPSCVSSAPAKETFVEAVRGASSGILGICAFVTAFSALNALLRSFGIMDLLSGTLCLIFPRLSSSFFSAALTGILEVTNGCVAASALHTFPGFVLCAFLVSFSSCSIIFQVKSCFSSPIDFGPFYRSRLAHGALTSLIAALLYRFIPPSDLAASATSSIHAPQPTPNMLVTTMCLICMCSILLFGDKKSRARGKNVHIWS